MVCGPWTCLCSTLHSWAVKKTGRSVPPACGTTRRPVMGTGLPTIVLFTIYEGISCMPKTILVSYLSHDALRASLIHWTYSLGGFPVRSLISYSIDPTISLSLFSISWQYVRWLLNISPGLSSRLRANTRKVVFWHDNYQWIPTFRSLPDPTSLADANWCWTNHLLARSCGPYFLV